MLNRYFIRPTTVDRIRASWVGDAIERYVVWLDEQNYAGRNVFVRVTILIRFGDFARIPGTSILVFDLERNRVCFQRAENGAFSDFNQKALP